MDEQIWEGNEEEKERRRQGRGGKWGREGGKEGRKWGRGGREIFWNELSYAHTSSLLSFFLYLSKQNHGSHLKGKKREFILESLINDYGPETLIQFTLKTLFQCGNNFMKFL